jgi:hypothetical protein
MQCEDHEHKNRRPVIRVNLLLDNVVKLFVRLGKLGGEIQTEGDDLIKVLFSGVQDVGILRKVIEICLHGVLCHIPCSGHVPASV